MIARLPSFKKYQLQSASEEFAKHEQQPGIVKWMH